MPILNPSIQHYLLMFCHNQIQNTVNANNFYFRYLRIASRNAYRNFSTIDTARQFKEDLSKSIGLIYQIFNCKLSEEKFEDLCISNYYNYLYNEIYNEVENQSTGVSGDYFMLSLKISNTFLKYKYFKPNVFFVSSRSWFLTDSQMAILSLKVISENEEEFQLIILEIDLMKAAGFTLVLTTNFSKSMSDFIFDLIKKNQFSEIHLNALSEFEAKLFLDKFKEEQSLFDEFHGYFYIYTPYIAQNDYKEIIKKLKKLPRLQYITYSVSVTDSLKKPKYFAINPFAYCKNGFTKKLDIFLSNVPIYDDINDSKTFVPESVSGPILCKISPEDFLNWKNERIGVIISSETNNNVVKKYVNFDDIHKIRKDLFVDDLLALSKINKNDHSNVDEIKRNIDQMNRHKNSKNLSSLFSKDKKIRNLIEYVINEYTIKEKNPDFSIYKSQIYSVLDACNTLLNIKNIKRDDDINNDDPNDNTLNSVSFADKTSIDNKIKMSQITSNKDKKYKGIIYQVETGEGKTPIIALIAAVLAKHGKTVHIVSSNIKLANRDYQNTYDFFESVNLKSAVLLHENELPVINRKNNQEITKSKSVDSSDLHNDGTQKIFMNNIKSTNDFKDIKNIIDNNKKYETIFKDNFENYKKENTKDNTDYTKYYTDKEPNYYNPKDFRNSSKMNFSVCGLNENNELIQKNGANIVYSNIVNLECFYLKMMELCPGAIDSYYKNFYLLIDEADSILIDEITNGTIISREMKSNSTEILKKVYDNKENGVSAEETFNFVKKNWPKCVDLKLKDIVKMYSEIDQVKQEEFTDGKKYSIETIEARTKKKKRRLNKKLVNFVKNVAVKTCKGLINILKSNDEKENEEEDEYDNDCDPDDNMCDSDSDSNDEIDDDNDINSGNEEVVSYKHIVPFDYNHKGILEPNKEFNGFIQQFIAIKESKIKENHNMIIKNMSMSYLYISHPIFVKLYDKICGFTGTVGGKYEKQIYIDNYNLTTRKIPRNKANFRVEFPIILCKDKSERNKRIVFEIIQFHKKGNPVLVIFQDLKEIEEVSYMLYKHRIQNVNIFNGKNGYVTPENVAGIKGAVSLGTNVCGRGADIKAQEKPLHVIITYFSSNTRVINQAHGRTARQGHTGTSRIICLKEQFLYPTLLKKNGIESVLEEFDIKNKIQEEYINNFMDNRKWIFSNDVKMQKLSSDQIIELRTARINVNRIVAYNFEFPLIMSIDTFLLIQAQKIFSLVNCPNCRYTWILFLRYVREMIFQSWSLMVNKVDEKFFAKGENQEFGRLLNEFKNSRANSELDNEKKIRELNRKFQRNIKNYYNKLSIHKYKLIRKVEEYIPKEIHHIADLFMHIFRKVNNEFSDIIIDSLKEFPLLKKYHSYNSGFMSCHFGLKPYSLLTDSGARISYKTHRKINYIKDPELRYMMRKPEKTIWLSITEKIDDIFNLIFNKVSGMLGNKTFLKFFLRRTLFGCEFGVCLSFPITNEVIKDENCIIDKDPMILFTISVKSVAPILAGILIFVAIYIGLISKDICEYVVNLPAKLTKEFFKKMIVLIFNIVSKELMNSAISKIIIFLKRKVLKNIEQLDENAKNIFLQLVNLFDSSKDINKRIFEMLGDKIKFQFSSKFKLFGDFYQILNISFHLLLCIASYMMKFNSHKEAIQNRITYSIEYTNACKINKNNEVLEKISKKDEEEISKNKVNDESDYSSRNYELSEQEKDQILKSFNRYNYNLDVFDRSEYVVELSNFIVNDENQQIIINRFAEISHCLNKKNKKENQCIRMRYRSFKRAFYQQVRLYVCNRFPSILDIIGYSIHNEKQDLFLPMKKNGTLKNVIDKIELNENQKLIIAYGIAKAIEYLHKNKVVHRNLNLDNIMIDSKFYPYVYEFYCAIQTDSSLKYDVEETTPEFMAPEFIVNYNSINDFSKIDVFSYGIILYILIYNFNPFLDKTNDEILKNTVSGSRPKFTKFIKQHWKKLIEDCWNQDPIKRPSFTDICKYLETKVFNGNSNDFIEYINSFKEFYEN